MFIVDVHAYLGHSSRFGESSESAVEDLIRHLDKAGVDRALVSDGGFTVGDSEGPRAANDRVAEAIAAYPDRLLGIGMLEPLPDTKTMLEEAERAITELGFIALRFYPSAHCHAANDAQSSYRLAEAAERLRVPLWMHTNEGPYSTPVLVADLAKRFSETNFVLAHRGYATGGLALYFVGKHPNLYFDMSSLVDWEIDFYSNFVDVSTIGLHKLLFGSYYPLGDASSFISILRNSRLSQDQQEAILGQNALRLIGEQ